MKKIITILTIFLLMLSGVSGFEDYAGFPPAPHPVGVRVLYQNSPINNIGISLEVINTGYSETRVTNNAGEAQFELANFKVDIQEHFPYNIGGEVKITVAGGQSQTIALEGGSDIVVFNLETEPEDYEPVKECPDGSIIPLDDECPEEEPEPPKVDNNDAETIADFNVAYGQDFIVEVSNNKLGNLLDEDIEVNGEDYAVSESIIFNGMIQTSIDNVDYIEPVLTVDSRSIIYTYLFEEPVPTSEFDSDDPLEISFAGVKTNIIEADDSKLIVQKGTEKFLNVGDTVSSGDKTIKVLIVGTNNVRFDVSGVEESIVLGSTKTVNDIEISVLEVYSGDDAATTIMYGNDVRRTITKGDGYIDEDDGHWIYDFSIVDDYLVSISLTNKNDYTNMDDKKGFIPLIAGESIWLDNQFAQIRFDSVVEYDSIDLEFSLDEGYLYVETTKESLIIGNDEYDEMYIDDDGFYDMDFELLTTDKVRIGDSDTYIELGDSISIGDLVIQTDLSDISYDGVSYSTKDDNYLDYNGITFGDVEGCVEDTNDCTFTVGVPDTDEDILATISIAIDGVIIPGEVEPVTPIGDTPVGPVTPPIVEPPVTPPIVEPPITPPVVEPPVVEPPVVEPPVEPPVDDEKNYVWIWWLIGIIIVIVLGWYFFLKKK